MTDHLYWEKIESGPKEAVEDRSDREEALKRSEALYRSLIENIQDVFYRSDLQGRLLIGSPSGAELFGYETVEEMIGLPLGDFWVNPDQRDILIDQIRKDGSVKDFEALLKKKDGETFTASFTTHFYYDESGNVLGTEGIIRDVTEKKRLEEQLMRSQKMEAIGTLAGGIAHDFNNLLHVIQGNAQMALLTVKEGDPGFTQLNLIKQAAKSASDLTQGLLTFSRRVEGRFRPLNLNRELLELEKILARTIPKMINVKLDLQEDLHTIKGDPSQIQQLMMNLAINARDAMPDGGVIEIKTGNFNSNNLSHEPRPGLEEGDHVFVRITDSGAGMDKETLERIYEPFFTTKAPGRGTGLGLSIAYGIVESHAGTIICDSSPGKGASFTVYFPSIGNWPGSLEKSDPPEMIGGNDTVLLVDDETDVLALGRELLTSFGYKVFTARDGVEGIDIYRNRADEIDIIILDLVMPRMDGLELLKRIMEIDPEARVVMTSGFASNGRVEDTLKHGAVATLRKPYEINELLTTIRKSLGE